MVLAMDPELVLAAAKANDETTAEALAAARKAAQSLVEIQTGMLFGLSPAGERTGTVFGASVAVIDALITQVDKAIEVLGSNLHLSADLVLKSEDEAAVDFAKLQKDNEAHARSVTDTGLRPGDPGYHPGGTAGQSSTQTYDPASDPTGTGTAGDAGGQQPEQPALDTGGIG